MLTRSLLLVSALMAILAACQSPSEQKNGADAGPEDAGKLSITNPFCVNGQSRDGEYPKTELALEMLKTIPDLHFERVASDGTTESFALHDYFDPCAAKPRLIILRAVANWCGTCRWSAQHTTKLVDESFGDRIQWIDLLVADDDNSPATAAAVPAWRARVDRDVDVALDPTFAFDALNSIHEPLPFFAVVDTWSMTIQYAAGNPDPEEFKLVIGRTFALLDHEPLPKRPVPVRYDDQFTQQDWDLLHDMTLPGAPPPDPTNAKADDAGAVALGKKLFSDTTLSPSGTVSCATCHDATKSFADGKPQSTGVSLGDRNSPSALLAAHARWQFWDGRADTLWMQAIGPFENDKEFDSSRLFVVHAIQDRYASEYETVFGSLPALEDSERFPAAGKPGQPEWDGMAAADQQAVNRVYSDVGKSIAAFERSLRAKPNRLDQYLAGDLAALSDEEKHGMKLFLESGCVQCHYGPRLTDDAFHVVRFPSGRQDGQADRGRIDAVSLLLTNDFNALGAFSDDVNAGQRLVGLSAPPRSLGAFKTAALRGVANTAPYGHGGELATLSDVVQTYSTRGAPPENFRAVGTTEPWVPGFARTHIDPIADFLSVLTAEPVPSE
jgi:cytochrome c peroxidase